MDADDRLIPLVEDDQGEGIKDFTDELSEIERLRKAINERIAKETWIPCRRYELEKGKSDRELLLEINNKLDHLIMRFDMAFGHYSLVNGKFIDLSKKFDQENK